MDNKKPSSTQKILIKEYLNHKGESPYISWLDKLNAQAAAQVTRFIERLGTGNTSNVKSLARGLYELKIDKGPGYRVYFGYENKNIVILLAGGTKRKQTDDIHLAHKYWLDYKSRRKQGEE